MFGLVQGLAVKAYTTCCLAERDRWEAWMKAPTFGLMSRELLASAIGDSKLTYPVSLKFHELVDACPLRIPHSPCEYCGDTGWFYAEEDFGPCGCRSTDPLLE